MKRKVVYQWSEDGVAEYCEREDITLEQEAECYHCTGKLSAGGKCVKLTARDGDIYLLHPKCAKKGIFKITQ